MNTPQALSLLHEMATNYHQTACSKEKKRLACSLWSCGRLMGFFSSDPTVGPGKWFQGSHLHPFSSQEIECLVEERWRAKKDQNYKEADRIRDDLLKKGVALEDTPQGTLWRYHYQ